MVGYFVGPALFYQTCLVGPTLLGKTVNDGGKKTFDLCGLHTNISVLNILAWIGASSADLLNFFEVVPSLEFVKKILQDFFVT